MVGRQRSIVSSLRELLIDDLDLLVDYSASETIDRHVHPVVLLTFDNEVGQVICAWRISTALCYNVDHQIPGTRLRNGRKSSGDNFPSGFHALVVRTA